MIWVALTRTQRDHFSGGSALRSSMNEFAAEPSRAKADAAWRPAEATHFVVNVLSRDNPDDEGLDLDEIGEFCNAVDTFETVFRFPESHKWLPFDDSKHAVVCKTPSCSQGIVARVHSQAVRTLR